jgi:hypothetical protein
VLAQQPWTDHGRQLFAEQAHRGERVEGRVVQHKVDGQGVGAQDANLPKRMQRGLTEVIVK